jgi:hypothetical protein
VRFAKTFLLSEFFRQKIQLSWLFYMPITTIFLASYTTCGLDIEDSSPPNPPVWVQKSISVEWPERGIDAHESGGIYLEWVYESEEEIVSYEIYRAVSNDNSDEVDEYSQIGSVDIEVSTTPVFVDNYVQPGILYLYKIRAKDSADNYGSFSTSTGYRTLPAINDNEMFPNGNDAVLTRGGKLSWQYYYTIQMELYIITILSESGQLIHRAEIIPGNYVGRTEYWQPPSSVIMENDQKYQWRLDISAEIENGIEVSGAESQWATFNYHEI